jgi:hypothetical protein
MAYIIVLDPIILSSAPMSPATSSSDATRRRMPRPRALTRDVLTSGDIEAEMANSVVYLDTFGHIVVAWILAAAGDRRP